MGGIAGTLVCVTLGGAASESPRERFVDAVTVAKANLRTAQGRTYDQLLSKHFERANGPVMQSCFAAVKEPDTTAFEMVFRVAKSGTVKSVLVWPETNISTCFRDALKGKAFPAPPADDYLAYMEMRFGP